MIASELKWTEYVSLRFEILIGTYCAYCLVCDNRISTNISLDVGTCIWLFKFCFLISRHLVSSQYFSVWQTGNNSEILIVNFSEINYCV